jgi:hypothetical protein
MPRRKIVLPAEPVTKPEPGSLEETIYLGDCAAAYAKPLAQLRWYDRRGELQIAIQNRNRFTERIAELEKQLTEVTKERDELLKYKPAPALHDKSVMVAKMLKQLDEWGSEPPVSTPQISEEETVRQEAEALEKAKQQKEQAEKAAEEARVLEEKRQARIAELKNEKTALIDRLMNPFRLKRVMQIRGYSDEVDQRLAEIDKELAGLEGAPVQIKPQPDPIEAEFRQEQAFEQAKWNWGMSDMQTPPPVREKR